MDESTTQDITDAQIKDVNRCIIYLQVFHTSDITDLAGNTIEDWAKQGKRQINRTSKWNWPVQQRQPASSWKKTGQSHYNALHQMTATYTVL
jgi:hypothetical protein